MLKKQAGLMSQGYVSHTLSRERPQAISAPQLRYVLIVPVWGDHHTNLFLRCCIPFLLTDGNIGAFPARRLKVHVASRRSDFVRMNEDANYQSLALATDLKEIEIDDLVDLSVPHRAMTECYLHVIRSLPEPEDTVTILPTPDCILSRNALKNIIALMEGGWRAVMVCGLRLNLETAGPLLDSWAVESMGAGAISERELCDVVLKHLHPITLSCDVASDEFMVNWPSHVYWIAPDRSWLIAHCFHLHPIAVRGVPSSIDIHTTIDGDYLMGLGVEAKDMYVCTDSDKFFCVELSPPAKRILATMGRLTKRALVRFSVTGCNPLHREFYGQAIRWRGLREPEIPDEVLRQTEDFSIAVQHGSRVEDIRHAVNMTIRRFPLLSFMVRFAMRVARWGLRRARRIMGGTPQTLSRRNNVNLD